MKDDKTKVVVHVRRLANSSRCLVETRYEDGTYAGGELIGQLDNVRVAEVVGVRNKLCERLSEEYEEVRACPITFDTLSTQSGRA